MINPEQDVMKFHRKMGQPCPRRRIERPPEEHIRLRIRMIQEEAEELIKALQSGDLTKITRESIDYIYIGLGTLVAFGIPLGPSWQAVQRANMRKQPPKRPGEKPGKPEGWRSPDEEIEKFLSALTCLHDRDEDYEGPCVVCGKIPA